MARSFLCVLIGLLAVFYLPWWWLTLGVLVLLAIVIKTPLLILFPALLFDLLYGRTSGSVLSFIGLFSITLVIPAIFFIKNLVRFN